MIVCGVSSSFLLLLWTLLFGICYVEINGFSIEDYHSLRQYSSRYAEENAPLMLGLIEELMYLNLKKWYGSEHGYFLKNAVDVEIALELGRKQIDCRRNHSLLYNCLITKHDGVDLQEWIMWQLLFVGTHQIFIYVNDPEADNTWKVIQPFIDAGYVTGFNASGLNKQNVVYESCLSVIRSKSCNFPGPMRNQSILSVKDCNIGQDYDIYQEKSRVVWVAGFDADEFPIDISGKCLIDALPKYDSSNGLALPWFHFGPSGHMSTPSDSLCTTTYFNRLTLPGKLNKGINRVYYISKMVSSHSAVFKDRKPYVDELLIPRDVREPFREAVPGTLLEVNASSLLFPVEKHYKNFNVMYPRYRLYHYLTKSYEHMMKKWIRGVADQSEGNRSKRRPLSDIIGWTDSLNNRELITDDYILYPYGKMLRELFTNATSRQL